jgi:tyrosine-protein kinase Etk/Wzc
MEKNDLSSRPTGAQTPMDYQEEMDDEINLVDFVYPIFKKRKLLIRFCVLVAIAAGIINFLLPKTYQATAIILPTNQDNSSTSLSGLASSLLGQSGLGGLISLGDSSSSTSSDVLEAVLKSSDLTADVLNRYDYFIMMGVNKKGESGSIKETIGSLNITTSKIDPTISISVQSKDPVFASELANSYVNALDIYNQNNSFTSTGNLRKYLEKRVEEANRELDEAQKGLRDFQEKNSAISISDQGQATLKVLAELEAQKVVLEVQKSAKERFYKGSYSELEQLKSQIDALKKNIDQLTYSQETAVPLKDEGGKINFYIPLNSIPGLGFDESKLLLKVKAKIGVITLLTTQLEQAKLDEAKDMPTINVLEWAVPPDRPVKPRIALNIVLSVVVSLFLGIFIVFIIEFIQRMDQDPVTAPKWQEMRRGIAGHFRRFRKSL